MVGDASIGQYLHPVPEQVNPAELRGRPPSTTRDAVSATALALFARNGFEETTMDDIAEGVGVSRRTVFRYFTSKNDIVWGDFATVRARLRAHLAESPADEPLGDAIRRAVVASNRYEAEELPELRARMALITSVPALQGHSMVRYEEWRGDLAEFVALRLGGRADDLVAQVVAQTTMATAMTAFVDWVRNPEADLEQRLDEALRVLMAGIGRLGA
ncbi:MAG TPA: mycofactocin system transcriptional regulator [Baekduia sp.]